MKNIYMGMMALLIVAILNAQQSKQKGNVFVSAQAALLNGDDHVNGQILLTGGYQLKGWFIGGGTGFDYYKYRTIPAFADVKKYFGKGDRQFFIYANGGSNIAWPTLNQYRRVGWGAVDGLSQFKNGIYTDVGFGYTLFNSKKRGFFTAAGYSTKTLSETYNEQIWGGPNPPIITKRTLEYTMNRVIIRVGYRF